MNITFGRNVYRVDTEEELLSTINALNTAVIVWNTWIVGCYDASVVAYAALLAAEKAGK